MVSFEGESSCGSYYGKIRRIPVLSREEEVVLAQEIEAGSLEARDRMVSHNLRLVYSIAVRYVGSGLHLDDLVQEGSIGLMLAIKKYDWRQGTRLSTFATRRIRWAIERAIDDQGRQIRWPVHVESTYRRYLREQRALTWKLGRDPIPQDVAEGLDVAVQVVSDLQALPQVAQSLDDWGGAEELSPDRRRLAVDEAASEFPDKVVGLSVREQMLEALRKKLDPRELEVLVLCRGLRDGTSRSHAEVADLLSLSRSRVQQIDSEACKKAQVILIREGFAVEAA